MRHSQTQVFTCPNLMDLENGYLAAMEKRMAKCHLLIGNKYHKLVSGMTV